MTILGNMRRLIAVLSAAVAVPSAGFAADVVGGVCNAALESGMRDNYYLLTEREQYDEYRRRLCDAKFSSYSSFKSGADKVSLSIPIGEALIGLSGSGEEKKSKFTEAYSKYCTSTYFESEFRSRFASYSGQVSQVLASNWRACHELHLDAWVKDREYGVFIDVVPQDNFSDFTVTVDNRKLATGNVKIEHIGPEGNVTCIRGGKAVEPGKTTVERNRFQLSCTKSPLREISFSIETNAGPSNSLSLPANSGKFRELQENTVALSQRVADLTAEVSVAKKTVAGVSQRLATWGPGESSFTADAPGKHGSSAKAECPNGQYVSGVVVIDDDKGGYCSSCLTRVTIHCRPLNR